MARYRDQFSRLLRTDLWRGLRDESKRITLFGHSNVASRRRGSRLALQSLSPLHLMLESLEQRQLLTVVPGVDYVDQSWTGLVNGTTVTLLDTSTHTIGTDAFSTIQGGITAVSTGGVNFVPTGGTTYVDPLGIGHAYNEAPTISSKLDLEGNSIATVNAGINPAGISISGGVDATVGGLTVTGGLTGISATGAGTTLHLNSSVVQNSAIFGVAANLGADVQINSSTITEGLASTAAVDVAAGSAEIQTSILTGSQRGLLVQGSSTASATKSDLAGNTAAVVNSTASVVDASGDWWGSNSESSVATQAGLGVFGPVDFTPYLSSGANSATVGFLGDFSDLHVTALGSQTPSSLGRIQEGVNLVTSGGTVRRQLRHVCRQRRGR